MNSLNVPGRFDISQNKMGKMMLVKLIKEKIKLHEPTTN